jgi:hypothetical protein
MEHKEVTMAEKPTPQDNQEAKPERKAVVVSVGIMGFRMKQPDINSELEESHPAYGWDGD